MIRDHTCLFKACDMFCTFQYKFVETERLIAMTFIKAFMEAHGESRNKCKSGMAVIYICCINFMTSDITG
jgi:hypothetical protein